MIALINQLCNAGLYLAPIPPDKNGNPLKAPKGLTAIGWNQPKSASNQNGFSNIAADFKNCEGFNFGLAHLPSRTAALDIDDMGKCLTLFADLGLPLADWLKDPNRVEILSGKLNRGKLLFRLPGGIDSFITLQFSVDKVMLFELRNSSKQGATVQDVIIGKHPETLTDYKIIGDIHKIPEMPAALLNVALHWEDWKPCLESALGIATDSPKIPPQRPIKGEHLPGWRNPIIEFNQSYTVAEVLLRNGYKQAGKDRFIRPGSTSKAPGVAILRNCLDSLPRAYSHGGDVLNDGYAHDAWDVYRLLECGGKW